ncbi:MAG: DNA-nicking endonuclease, Smr domain [Pelagibacterales bacterium]|nr:DNA-nicking endonuclease, Smr domain [Pelagibacterales bacterium]
MKKKNFVSLQDKKDWLDFTKNIGEISPKKEDLLEKNEENNKIQKLDLHGFSLKEANDEVKNFIIKFFYKGVKKLIIITGKGSRSKSYNNPYVSETLGVLKNSIPDFIKNDENLNSKILKISSASIKDGGEGAIYIFLKNNKSIK